MGRLKDVRINEKPDAPERNGESGLERRKTA